jgi:hypothetical protein
VATIAGYSFIAADGMTNIAHPAPVLEDITAPGFDGIAEQDVGYKAEESTFRTYTAMASMSGSTVASTMTAYLALQGETVSITDDLDVTTPYVRIYSVRLVRPMSALRMASLVTGAVGMLECEWRVRALV